MPRQVTMGLLFFPRGGSAQVTRYLRRALRQRGWNVPLATGSLGEAGEETNAETFFDGTHLHVMDYTAALEAHRRGEDAYAGPKPMHPSYEDRPGAADRVFTAIPPRTANRLTSAWERVFAEADFDGTSVFHLHHLTPMHDAIWRLWAEAPVVGHLHGTELNMLEQIEARRRIANALSTELIDMPEVAREAGALTGLRDWSHEQRQIIEHTNWDHWQYGDYWESKLRAIAHACDRLITISQYDRERAIRLLKLSDQRVEWITNGVDIDRFTSHAISPESRMELLRRWLVDDPRGWDESGEPGTIRYSQEQVEQAFRDPESGELYPALIYVGRFLDFKRVPMLIRAYRRARARFEQPAPLIIWGGSPGEWENEHPYTVAREVGDAGIFFTGWRGHDELPLGLNCANVMVAPSYHEPMGQVYLEAMATGIPVIATDSGGPPAFINAEAGRPNGWLIPTDDSDALVEALVVAVNNPAERSRRATNAAAQIRRDYSWAGIAALFENLYEQVRASR